MKMMNNNWLLVAGVVAAVTAAAHVVLGQAHMDRVLTADLQDIDGAVMFAVWHMASVVLAAAALGFVWLSTVAAGSSVRAAALFGSLLFGGFGVVFVVASTLFNQPALQWIPMLVISSCAFMGYRRA